MPISQADIAYAEPEDWPHAFTTRECEDAATSPDPVRYLATVWTVREAVLKVLGGGRDGLAPIAIEVEDAFEAFPRITLVEGAADKSKCLRINQIFVAGFANSEPVCAYAVAIQGQNAL